MNYFILIFFDSSNNKFKSELYQIIPILVKRYQKSSKQTSTVSFHYQLQNPKCWMKT